jgi:hypothetical protein
MWDMHMLFDAGTIDTLNPALRAGTSPASICEIGVVAFPGLTGYRT